MCLKKRLKYEGGRKAVTLVSAPCDWVFKGKLVALNPHERTFNLFVCEKCKKVYTVSSYKNICWLEKKLGLYFRRKEIQWDVFCKKLKKLKKYRLLLGDKV